MNNNVNQITGQDKSVIETQLLKIKELELAIENKIDKLLNKLDPVLSVVNPGRDIDKAAETEGTCTLHSCLIDFTRNLDIANTRLMNLLDRIQL